MGSRFDSPEDARTTHNKPSHATLTRSGRVSTCPSGRRREEKALFIRQTRRLLTWALSICCSWLKTRVTMMFSRVSAGSSPNRSAMASIRSGRKLPSVSMYTTWDLGAQERVNGKRFFLGGIVPPVSPRLCSRGFWGKICQISRWVAWSPLPWRETCDHEKRR